MSGAGRLDDEALLDLVQRQTFRYFWDFAHPVSGLTRERSNRAFGYGDEVVTTGGSGFGVMAIVTAVARGWIGRAEAVRRLVQSLDFLYAAQSYHGVLPHFMDGATGRTIPFTRKDDGGDLVETAFLMMGLLCARQYFDGADTEERRLRARVTSLWEEVEWSWHTQGGRNVLYWHWSPNNGWSLNHPIRGWNECLVVYVLAAGAPRHPIDAGPYHQGWASGPEFLNGRPWQGITLPLGPEGGGPLFFTHYSFMGLDPRGLVDRYADYWAQNRDHVLLNHAHCVRNPNGWAGYGPACWGLTASDDPDGYVAHSPTDDRGVISPTAALGSFPYAPELAMAALRHFHEERGDALWGEYGFRDAFCPARDWVAQSWLAIDQGPIVVMIENWRSGLLWRLFMSCPEVRAGLTRLGFTSPHLPEASIA